MTNRDELLKLASVFNTENIITSEDIEQVLKGILVIMNSFKNDNQTLNKETTTIVENLLTKVLSEHEKIKDDVSQITSASENKISSKLESVLSEVKAIVKEINAIEPPENGKDADEEKIIESVLSQIQLPEQKEIILDTPEEIADKLESLKGDNRLDASAIKNLPEIKGGKFYGGSGIKEVIAGTNITVDNSNPGYPVIASNNSGGGHIIEEEGTPLTQRANLNFVGASVTVTDDAGNDATIVTITGGGAVDSVNGQTGVVVLDADDIDDTSTTHKFVTAADITKLGNLSGTNTGDQTTITGNAGTATALQTARTIGGVSFDGTANITVATATGGFTVSGGNLAIGTNSLTMTGDIGSSGSRVANGYFVNALISSSGTLTFATAGSKNITINQGTIAFNDSTGPAKISLIGATMASEDSNKTITLPNATGTVALISDIPSLTGYVTTDQTVGQTIGATGARLTKLWATDITVTNAIAGSITGNAATVTTNANLTGDVTSSGNSTTIAAGAVDIAMLSATGTPSSSTYLRGDNTWASIGGGGDVSKVGTPVNNQIGVWTGDGTIEGTSGLTYDGSNLQLTGDIGSTGARITKGWFTDLTVTNAISGSVIGNAGTATALQNARTIGGVSFDGTANIVPQTIQSINEATDTTCFPLFITASGSQSLQPMNNTALTFNSNTGALGATSFVGAGTSLTGIPYTITGTSNQVIASAGTGNITLSLPQSIATSSTPQFAKIGIGAAADASRILYVTGDVSGGVATIQRSNASTNAAVGTVIIKGKSTGDMVDGFGSAFQFAIEDTANTENLIANIQGVRDGADNSGRLVFATYNAGTPAAAMTIYSDQTVSIITSLEPDSDNAVPLGSTTWKWSDLFLGEGGVINWDNGDVTMTQTGNVLAVAGGDLRVATADVGTNADSVPTLSSTSTFTNKTLTTPVINGTITGTGQATAATASTITMRDTNANITVNSVIAGYTTTATAAGTTTLTISSTYQQFFTGATTQAVTMPASVPVGQAWYIQNSSTGLVTVNATAGANTILILAGGTSATFTSIVNTASPTAASWSFIYDGHNDASGKKLTVNNTLTLAGTDGTTMTFPSTSATIARTDAANTFTGVQNFTSPDVTTSITTSTTSFTAFAGATTLLTIGGTGASASLFAPSTLDTTSSTTGAIRTSGGISAAKALNIGTNATIAGAIINTNNAITASGNAATVPVTASMNTVTNNSAATLTITMATASAVDRQKCIVNILDFSAAAQTITWVNTENSTVTAPTTSNGSTTLPLTVGFIYNNATSKWRCVASA